MLANMYMACPLCLRLVLDIKTFVIISGLYVVGAKVSNRQKESSYLGAKGIDRFVK